MHRAPYRQNSVGVCAVLLACLAGCQDGNWPGWNRELPPEPAPKPGARGDPILADTIGSVTVLAGIQGQPVRGFGLVVGLGENGSRDCPTTVRQHLIEVMTKESETWSSLKDRKDFKPGQLIDSPTTAVVDVYGIVLAGSPAHIHFDIRVDAIPGTAARSLAGGLLLPCGLHICDPTASQEELLGAPVVARAAGPVFVNPLAGERVGADRRGVVLSGAQTTGERTTRLLLREPSYPMARGIERRINERFGQRPPTADATSRGYVVLHTPAQYARRAHDFARLVTHLYFENHPTFTSEKLRELARLITLPDADYEHIALAWEGIGRTALPSLQPLYSHNRPQVRYYAARAGLRLKDTDALPVLGELAASTHYTYAQLAARELGRCEYPQAALKLLPLLDSTNQEVRIAAYEALLKHRHPAIESLAFPHVRDPIQLNFALDVVESAGEPLIYVRTRHVPRIVVFGRRTRVALPLFYNDADDTVTLNASDNTDEITLFTKRGGRLSKPLTVPPRVVELIAALGDRPVEDDVGRIRGVSLSYAKVVRLLSVLCEDGTIPARLVLERDGLTEMLGPETSPERPEADQS